LWVSEKQNLRGNVAELQTKNFSMATERGFLYQKNTALRAEVESLKAQLNDNIAGLAQMQDERVQNERVLQQYRTENIEKEGYCRALVSDKRTLETRVLQLTDKSKVISAEFEAARKAWELDKDGLFSQVVAARKEAEEITKSCLITEQAWIADKENLLSSLSSTYEKKIEDMSALNQRVLLEKTELESQLNESKERTRALLEKLEDERNFWVSEKQKLRGNVAELQTKIFSMATERGLLCQKNTALRAEAEYLKAQLNENIARVAQMQDERVVQQYRSENIELQSNLNDSKGKTGDLLKKIEEDTHLWDAEKSNLEGTVAELRAKHELMAREMGSLTQKNRELTVDAELIKNQVNALESELNESKKRSLELLQKSEEDWCLWDEKKSNLEGTLAELQTEHEDLMLKLSRKKALEEESRATMPPLEEMKESTSEGEMQIAELSSQFLAVAEEKDDQLSDIQRQLSAMAEEKRSQLATLQDQLSSIAEGKKILEDENKSLQTELDRRALVSEEVKVRLEGRVRELQTTLNSLTKELEYSRAIAGEKERQLVDLQNRHSKLVEAKNCLENKNDSLLTELNRCTMGSDENIRLQNRIRELETAVESLKQDIESKDNRLQKLMSESQNPWRKPLVAVVNGNGNPKRNGVLNENPKCQMENQMPHLKSESLDSQHQKQCPNGDHHTLKARAWTANTKSSARKAITKSDFEKSKIKSILVVSIAVSI
jgi:chromosome segregation ATPase